MFRLLASVTVAVGLGTVTACGSTGTSGRNPAEVHALSTDVEWSTGPPLIGTTLSTTAVGTSMSTAPTAPLTTASEPASAGLSSSTVSALTVDQQTTSVRSEPAATGSTGSTSDNSTLAIGRDTPTLAPGPVVYTGPVVVSQGPAAAYVAGVGIIGTVGGDADRHFDLALVSSPKAPLIGVGVTLTPMLLGAPDGRLYVVDVGRTTMTAYSIVSGIAKRTDGPAGIGKGCATIVVDAAAVSCGQASIALGPTATSTAWTTANLDNATLADVAFVDVSNQCLTYSGCQTWTLADGTRVSALEIEWQVAGSNYVRTAVIVRSATHTATALIDGGPVAALDALHRVIYAWNLFDLVANDLTTMLSN